MILILDILYTLWAHNILYTNLSIIHIPYMRPSKRHYYDLSKRFASVLSPILLGQCEEGIWHTSVGIYGQEGLCEAIERCP